jgi:hypothetical protein
MQFLLISTRRLPQILDLIIFGQLREEKILEVYYRENVSGAHETRERDLYFS